MIIGEVIGNVWATKKYDGLEGLKFLIVKTETNGKMVAFDAVGAGIGEKVIVATGGAARTIYKMQDRPVDAAIIGIIDGMDEE
ncbi:EutN/CcmL family microcompartment protein [Fusobacterium massiliense]|jgi:ethanolamine utilization protein eutN|uniref:EutN/CcmL family microcompartment protein n=1 Tax=Fusobacterium massiliense TaxID=1852365 RepID=UPI00093DBBFC|nr:EutN/CcmL family microcompartment protein [Fusobacterium massiliense]